MPQHDYTENWDSFPSPIEEDELGGERVGFFFIDLGLAEIAPVADMPNLVRLRLNILQPDENGLPDDREAAVLNEMEDALVTVMASQFDGIYPGRVTVRKGALRPVTEEGAWRPVTEERALRPATESERSFYFYLGKKTSGDEELRGALLATLARVMADFPEYKYECRLQEDPEWKNYLEFMYPEPVQLQSMQNRRVVYQLMQHGDRLTVPRPVEHWIDFKTTQDREAYWNRVNAMGFELLEMSMVEADDDEDDEELRVTLLPPGEYPYSLHITRDDKVDYDSIDACVLPLWGLASEYDGNYDGWETGIVQGEE